MEMHENPTGQVVDIQQDVTQTPVEVDAAVLLLGAGVTAATHPLLYVKLLIQVAGVANVRSAPPVLVSGVVVFLKGQLAEW